MRKQKSQGPQRNLILVTKLMLSGAGTSTITAALGFCTFMSGDSHTHIRSESFLSLIFLFPFAFFLLFIMLFSILLLNNFLIHYLFNVLSLLFLSFQKNRNILHIACSIWKRFFHLPVCFCFQCLWNGNSDGINVLSMFARLSRYTLKVTPNFFHCQYHDFVLFFVNIPHFFHYS